MQHRTAIQLRSAAGALCLLLLAGWLAGCAARTDHGVRDLAIYPQNAGAYHGLDPDAPLLAPEVQDAAWRQFLSEHFGPWERTGPAFTATEVFWGLDSYAGVPLYGENTRLHPEGWFETLRQDCRVDQYPSMAQRAIAVVNTSMRVLPTHKPGFRDFTQPGEGYPFDYLQNSLVLAGTPLYATHLSADRAWIMVESRFAFGWVPVTDIAWVDEGFISVYRTGQYAALTRDDVPVADIGGSHRFNGHVGTILPVLSSGSGLNGKACIIPVRTELGRAVPKVTFLPTPFAHKAPIPATPANFAAVANAMLGRPYGWGGMYEDRDCSAATMDLLAGFGFFLPRNSSQQAREGTIISLEGLNRDTKRQMLRAYGTPFLTLVRKPGHIMLYIGAHEGNILVFHAVWGLKTEHDGQEGRHVIGRAVITTLTPGSERDDIAPSGLLIDSVSSMTTLP